MYFYFPDEYFDLNSPTPLTLQITVFPLILRLEFSRVIPFISEKTVAECYLAFILLSNKTFKKILFSAPLDPIAGGGTMWTGTEQMPQQYQQSRGLLQHQVVVLFRVLSQIPRAWNFEVSD